VNDQFAMEDNEMPSLSKVLQRLPFSAIFVAEELVLHMALNCGSSAYR
jgi:hypothetical protein